MVDASTDHVSRALQQRYSLAADWQPLAFLSKQLEPAQMRYSSIGSCSPVFPVAATSATC
jgi:hypothetical protein